MKCVINTIPAEQMRYPTVGDWFYTWEAEGTVAHKITNIKVARMADWRYEACVAVHELVEQLICEQNDVSDKDVDNYDKTHEESGDEPDIPGSPYRKAHWTAYIIEMILSEALGLSWTKYSEALDEAYDKIKKAGKKL